MASSVRIAYPPQDQDLNPLKARRLDQMLSLADARPEEGVCVAGPDAGDAMCALWRRGYDRVEAARRCTCGCADQKRELLLVMGGASAEHVAGLVSALSPILAKGGRLVIAAHDLADETERQTLCDRLAEQGFLYRPGAARESIILAFKPGA
jgi:hypothetical protein